MAQDNLIRLYDGYGRTLSELHPQFRDKQREFQFQASYNPDPMRRGSSGGIYQNAGSNSFQKLHDMRKAMWDARDAVRYTWIGGVLNRLILYICGNLQLKADTGDDQVNQMYQDYFWNWAGDEESELDGTIRCDETGRARFAKMIQMAMMGFFTDGDYGFIEIDPTLSPNGEFCLQGIQADRIGSPLECLTLENYIGGITIDPPTGRILSYRIWRRTRTNQYVDKQEVPVTNFIHLIDPENSDEYRSYTKLLRLLNDLRDIREWIEFEKQAGKVQSQYAALVGLKDPFNNQGPFAWSGQTKNGTPYMDAEYGKILRTSEGETFSLIAPPSRPSGAFQGFIETVIRMTAISLNISYGLMWNIATLGGATARIEVESDARRIVYWQKMLRDIVIKRVYKKVIAQGIATQALPPTRNWKNCIIGFGKFITADIGYDMEADISATTHGIVKVEDIAMKHGSTIREVFEANAKAFNEGIAVGSEQGVPIEVFAPGLYPNGTAQKAAYLTPTPVPEPPPASLEAIGDKGLAKLIEICQSVKEGTLDRVSAINMLMRAFHLTRKQADDITPDEPTPADKNRMAGLDVRGNHPTPAKISSSNGSKKPARK